MAPAADDTPPTALVDHADADALAAIDDWLEDLDSDVEELPSLAIEVPLGVGGTHPAQREPLQVQLD